MKTEARKDSKKIAKKNKKAFWGYGVAGFGDSTYYNIIGSFLLFFLTSVAHVPTVAAGFISSLGSIADGVWSPIMGFISDNSASPGGRRRPYIIRGAVLCLISTALIFIAIPGGAVVKCLYYGALVIAFWISFATFFVPYAALGAEIATDYDDRTWIRTLTSFFNSAGSLLSTVLPTSIVALIVARGISRQAAWMCVGIIVGVAAFFTIFIAWKLTDGAELVKQNLKKKKVSVVNVFREYFSLLKLKTIRYLLLGSILSLIAYTMMTTGKMYLFTYNMGYSEAAATLVYFFSSIIWMASAPVIKVISDKLDKRGTFILGCFVTIAAGVVYGLKGMENFIDLMVYILFISMGNCCYWQLFPAMMYDISEVDTYINGTKREGSIMSLQSLAEAFASAFAMFLAGVVLNAGGYDGTAAVQSASAEFSILSLNTFFPAAFYLIGLVCVWKFPLTRERHHMLQAAIAEGVKAEDKDPKYQDLEVLL